jgi:hypothetical protein
MSSDSGGSASGDNVAPPWMGSLWWLQAHSRAFFELSKWNLVGQFD